MASTAEPAQPRGARSGQALVRDLSEEQLLARVVPLLPTSDLAIIGPGDDCAVMSAPDGRYCVSTDVLVEGRHFRTDWSSGRDVGRRAAAQNLADAAAMGARPVALVVSLVLPGATPVPWVEDLARGLAEACRRVGAGVVGGDLSAGDHLVIAATVHGDLQGRAPVVRSGARVGDVVVLAGRPGRSAAGLALLKAGLGGAPGPAARCVTQFRAPAPPLAAGPALAEAGATAMMDTSDSLLRDAGRIARASGVVVDLDDPGDGGGLEDDLRRLLPIARMIGARRAVEQARQWVLTGGEDHAMLATAPRQAVESLPPGARVIGVVEQAGPRAPGVLVAGRPWESSPGWDHFLS